MGKAIKAVQEALINLGVTGRKSMTWVCVQQAKTNSFREAALCNSFNSLYYSFTSSSSSKGEELERVIVSAADDDEGGDQSFSSTTSMNVTSSPLWTTTESPYDDSSQITETSELATKSSISSKRFFFSPCTTKSIMGEEEEEAAAHDDDDDEEEEVESRRMKLMSMMSHDGVTMAVASENPYQDFKESMEEMVRGHEIKSWNGLQELLHCYLSLNDRTNHQTILLAFVDLLINLVASRSQRTSRPCTSISPPAESGH